ncbi:hypothetical protein DSECCO2_614460 [anaerobic digester metagenome]
MKEGLKAVIIVPTVQCINHLAILGVSGQVDLVVHGIIVFTIVKEEIMNRVIYRVVLV